MTRTYRVHIGCLPQLVFMALCVATVYWVGVWGLWLFIEVLTTVTAIGANAP